MKHLYKIVTLLLLITNISIAQHSRFKLFTTRGHYNGGIQKGSQHGIMLYLHTHTVDNSGVGVFWAYDYTSLDDYEERNSADIGFTLFYRFYYIHSAVYFGVSSEIKYVSESSRENKYKPTVCGGLLLTYDEFFFKPIIKTTITPKSFTLTGGIGF